MHPVNPSEKQGCGGGHSQRLDTEIQAATKNGDFPNQRGGGGIYIYTTFNKIKLTTVNRQVNRMCNCNIGIYTVTRIHLYVSTMMLLCTQLLIGQYYDALGIYTVTNINLFYHKQSISQHFLKYFIFSV